MLVRDLLHLVGQLDQTLLDTLTLDQLVRFCSLAADFILRTKDAYRWNATQAPIEFLIQSLSPNPTYADVTRWSNLWYITAASLAKCYIDPATCVRTLGIPEARIPKPISLKRAVVIPEVSAFPPKRHCIKCSTEKQDPLPFKQQIYAYLFNVGGIQTLQYFTTYCRSKSCHADIVSKSFVCYFFC